MSPHLQRVIETLLDAFLTGQVSQAFEHTRDDPEPVQRALSFMRVQLDRDAATPLALPDLARAARVSPEHLCRLFREALDVGPMEAVRLSRLERAVTLLTRSNLNVEQVARRCGFASPYHFSRVFKDVFGQPPTIVRRNVAAGGAPPVSPLLRG
ncbi:MAG: helix-turn-helix transcriptional regulator [Phycisphaeraceae bacterium]